MKSVFHSALSLSLLAALSCTIATVHAAPPSGQGIIVLGKDCNSPTKCDDKNADSLSINEAAVGSTVWAAVQASGFYNWGYFGSSMTAPNDTFYASFPTFRRWYSYDVGEANQNAEDRAPYCPPNQDYDYWVTGTLTTPNDGNVDTHYGQRHVYKFNGRSLTIEGNIAHCSKGTSICDFGTNVIFKSGEYGFPALGTKTGVCSRGKAKVDGTSFHFAAGSGMTTRSACYLDWSMSGAPESQFSFTHAATQTATWWWCGDCSAYYGRCVVSSANATASNYSILAISNSVFNGTIEVQKFERLQSFGDDAFIARAEIAEDATLDVASGHTTRIGTLVLDGKMNFTATSSRLGLTEGMTLGPDSLVQIQDGMKNAAIITMPSEAVFDLTAFVAAMKRGTVNAQMASVKMSDNGDGTKSVIVTAKPTDGKGGTIEVNADATISGGDANVRVSVAEGKTLDLVNGNDQRMAINLRDNASLNIRRRFEDWETLPTLWLDASVDASISNVVVIYENSTYNYNVNSSSGCYLKMGSTVTDTQGNPLVKGWLDRRPEMHTYKIWNARYDKLYNDHNAVMAAVHPRRIKGGLNGMDYLTFDLTPQPFRVTFSDDTTLDVTSQVSGNARAYVLDYATDITTETQKGVSLRYAFIVFGSQQGGGDCLLGNNSSFVRAGTSKNHTASDPIFASNAKGATVWLDGQEVDPLTTGFDGGWQVVTVEYKNVSDGKFSTFGYNDGQNYAEVIAIEQELTERQRQTIEVYLAEKWGLADKYHYPDWAKDPFATVYGAGTVKLEANATLGGAFKGTVNLNGNNLVIDGAALPPTEAAIDTTGLEGWYDPDAEGKTREDGPTRLNLVPLDGSETIKNGYTIQPELHMIDLIARNREKVEGSIHLYGQPQRAPWLNKSARLFGPARKWMEFSNFASVDQTLYKGVSDGKVLRFSKVNNAGNLDGNTYQQPMQTLFMVQDSVNGGGHPFADGATVNAPVLYRSRTGTASAIGQPIYPTLTDKNGTYYTDGILTNGITCIDGREVDGVTESFGARPEVLTVVPTNTFNMVAIGQLNNSENKTDGHHEVIGEIMIYNRKLEAAERKVVEAYLSYKWLGIANAGYSALTDATVTGAGKVTATSAALLPKFAAGFTGTVSVPLDDGLAFTLATVDQATTVVGALDFGGGALEIPAGVTALTVSVAASGAKPHSGSYKLIGWAAKPAVTWNLSLDGWTREQCALRVADDGLYLDLERLGMTVIVR